MTENQVAVSADIDQRVCSYEEHGQTVVLAAIDGQPSTHSLILTQSSWLPLVTGGRGSPSEHCIHVHVHCHVDVPYLLT